MNTASGFIPSALADEALRVQLRAQGVAVLSSDAGSLPEVLGQCAVFSPPRDPEAGAEEVLDLLADGTLRTTLGTRGRARATTFTWARTAQMTRALFDEALGRKVQ